MSDMLGNNHLAISGEINGRIREARALLGYTNLAHRWQFTTALSQQPYYFLSADSIANTSDPDVATENQQITTYVARQAFAVTAYPLDRFTRIEFGAGFNNIDRTRDFITRKVTDGIVAGGYSVDSTHRDPSLNYVDGQVALVSDNTLFGYTGPVMGRRFRFQVSPVTGSYHWVEYLADYRRYDPIIFNYLTLATRAYTDLSIGKDETAFQKYIARPDFVRGYDRNSTFYLSCPVVGREPDQLQRRAAARQSCRRGERRAPLPAHSAARVGIPPWRAAAPRRTFLLRRGSRLVARPIGFAFASGRLRCEQGSHSAPQLRLRPATQPVQLRHPAVGLRDSSEPGRTQGALDVVTVAELLTALHGPRALDSASTADMTASATERGFDWEAAGRGLGESLNLHHAIVVVGHDPGSDRADRARGSRERSRRIVACRSATCSPTRRRFSALVRDEDAHGLVEAISYGISLSRVARAVVRDRRVCS